MGFIRSRSPIVVAKLSLTLRNATVIVGTFKSIYHHVHMQLWLVGTKLRIHMITWTGFTQLRHTERLIVAFSYQLISTTCLLKTDFCHWYIRSNVVGLQQSGFERVHGSGKKLIVLTALEQTIISANVGMPLHYMDSNREPRTENHQLQVGVLD
jgi:hypothetical protein